MQGGPLRRGRLRGGRRQAQEQAQAQAQARTGVVLLQVLAYPLHLDHHAAPVGGDFDLDALERGPPLPALVAREMRAVERHRPPHELARALHCHTDE